jgi:hypothetical protein
MSDNQLEKDQQREYRTVSYLVSALANICAAPPNKIIDLLTGYLWDEEEAGEIKMANMNTEADIENPLPEPVMYIGELAFNELKKGWCGDVYCTNYEIGPNDVPLYAEPQARKELTDDDWLEINGSTNGHHGAVVLFNKNGEYFLHHSVWVSEEESINTIKDERSKCYLSTLELGYTHWKPLIKPSKYHGITDTEQSKPKSNAI